MYAKYNAAVRQPGQAAWYFVFQLCIFVQCRTLEYIDLHTYTHTHVTDVCIYIYI